MLVIGLDIGGANLKAATSDGAAADRSFPLWRFPDALQTELESLLAELPTADAIAVTMTGELADCFASKPEGVRAIVAASTRAAGNRRVVVWQTGGEFVSPEEAIDMPRLVAAANWHALATFCGRVVPHGPGLLIDVGSTTTDLIALLDGRVAAEGLTDLERLRSNELVYTGATRTPVCALGPSIAIGEVQIPFAAELFATTRDVYLLLGSLSEADEDTDTADRRPATFSFARSRLARMFCADPDEIGDKTLLEVATAIAASQRSLIRAALERILDRIGDQPHVLLSGSGAFIGESAVAETPRLLGAQVTSLSDLFARRVSRSACAFAVARLAAERLSL